MPLIPSSRKYKRTFGTSRSTHSSAEIRKASDIEQTRMMDNLPTLYPRFSDSEYQRRFGLVRAMMDREGVEALLIFGGTGAASIHYLTNHLTRSGAWLFFPKSGDPTLFVNLYNHIPTAKNMSLVSDVRCYHPSGPKAVAEELRQRGLHTKPLGVIGLGSTIPYNAFVSLEHEVPEAEFRELSRPFNWIRWRRSEEELEWFRKSAHLTDLTCELLEQRIRPGLTEHDLVSIIHEACVPFDGNPTLHFITTTPMEAPERCLPWQYPTDRRLAVGDMITTEITVAYWTYASQTHRPYTVGREPNQTYRRLFDAAHECFERVRGVLKPGCTSEDVVRASSVIEQRGFTTYDSVLHGEAARNPELGTPSSPHPMEPWTFEENMVVVIQPNPVTPDFKAGLQLGSAVVIKSGAAEVLQKYPFRFTVCG